MQSGYVASCVSAAASTRFCVCSRSIASRICAVQYQPAQRSCDTIPAIAIPKVSCEMRNLGVRTDMIAHNSSMADMLVISRGSSYKSGADVYKLTGNIPSSRTRENRSHIVEFIAASRRTPLEVRSDIILVEARMQTAAALAQGKSLRGRRVYVAVEEHSRCRGHVVTPMRAGDRRMEKGMLPEQVFAS